MMKGASSKISFRQRLLATQGSAIIIVLAFVVLLTGLILAFFSRAMSDRQVSNSSANQTREEIFAQGAVDTIVGDLKQEIAAGSTGTTITSGSVSTVLYFPNSAATMIPATCGTSGSVPSFAPNLLKRSAYNQPFFSGTYYNTANYPASSRAANISSTGTSQNGRFITSARWNKALLLPKQTPSSTTDFTPLTSGSGGFVAPDWILVARDGSNPTTWGSSLTSTGTNPVVGRYAYTIYDEGGLLDMNVAGCPTGMPNLPQYSGKGSLALADLTQLTDSTGTQVLNQAQIDAIVGWRNYATAQPTGTFPNFGITGTAVASNYYNFAFNNTKGFLTVGGTALYNHQSDRMFTSRQQLISLLTTTGTLGGNTLAATQNALQYLGTFSRDLEQPSFVPDPNRPRNNTHPLKAPYAGSAGASLGFGGNDAYYATPPADPQTGAVPHQDDINPSLLTARDSSGNPVLKRRFPLSRLALVVTPPHAADVANIKKYFGLVWDTTNCRWTYTSPDGNSARSGIKTLDQIAKLVMVSGSGTVVTDPNATQREPDFFETLKAVINCDSLGKQNGIGDGAGGTGSDHVFKGNAASIDGRIDYQVFKIGADIIDQYDADSYPTRIFIADKPISNGGGGGGTPAIPYDNTLQLPASSSFSTYPREIYGDENVPYLYGQMVGWYRTQTLSDADIDPAYQPPSGAMVDGTATNNPAVPSFSGHTFYEVAALMQPILWNPNVPASPAVYSSSANYPAGFQVVAGDIWKDTTSNAVTVAVYDSWWMRDTVSGTKTAHPVTQYPVAGGLYSYPLASIGPINTSTGISPTYIQFQTSSTSDFREPYRLHAPLDPPGSSTTAYPNGIINTTDLEETPSTQALGFYLGKAWAGPVFTIGTTKYSYLDEGSPNTNVRLHLQFKNPYSAGPAYLTYDTISYTYLSSANGHGHSLIASDDTVNKIRSMDGEFRMGGDPRTDRWGVGNAPLCPFWDSQIAKWDGVSVRPAWMTGYSAAYGGPSIYYYPQGKTLGTGMATDPLIKLAVQNNSVSWAPGWEHNTSNGLPVPDDMALNSNSTVSGASTIQPGNTMYYMDPDGVVRRALGAYYNPSTTDGLPTDTGNNNSRPMILNRPFRSVAELGYVFRGQAWKDIDFFTPESGDAALLDAFCLNELDNAPADVTVAGRVNLNTRQPQVLQALIQGVSKAEGGILSGTSTSSEAAKAAQALVNWTTNTTSTLSGVLTQGPLRNRGELVGKFVSQVTFAPKTADQNSPPTQTPIDGSKSYSGFSAMLTAGAGGVFSNAADAAIKRRRECVMRALVDSGNTRTWNLMIDVVAQIGRYPANTTGLDKFLVEGETRYWVHLAIDRYTGQVVAKQVEPIIE